MGFPVAVLPLLRCPADGAELRLAEAVQAVSVETGRVECISCGATFAIRTGILDLLGDATPSHNESAFELAARDGEARRSRGAPGVQLTASDGLEIRATLRLLGSVEDMVLLELGCGAGTYTRLLESHCANLVAVDFSWEHLVINQRQLARPDRVGLVRADVAVLRLATGRIDRTLTTLYSNLPSREVREAMNETVRSALRPGGVYLVSAHHQELRRRLRRQPASGRYRGSGIHFRAFTRRELCGELVGFSRLAMRTCDVRLPIMGRYLRSEWVSTTLERIPGLNEFGSILLVRARKPS